MAYDMAMVDGCLHIRLSDTLTDADLGALVNAMIALESTEPEPPSRVTDLTAVTRLEIGFRSMLALTERRRIATLPGDVRSALVVADDVQYGIARMFQALNENPRILMEIFRDRDEALAWVREISATERAR